MTRHFTFRIKGTFYYDAIDAFEQGWVLPDVELQMKPEPTNHRDGNAIQIWHKNLLLGYIPRNKTIWFHFLIQENRLDSLKISSVVSKQNLLKIFAQLEYQQQRFDRLRFWYFVLKYFLSARPNPV